MEDGGEFLLKHLVEFSSEVFLSRTFFKKALFYFVLERQMYREKERDRKQDLPTDGLLLNQSQ